MNMEPMSQPGDLTPLDMQRYFGWPPPPPPPVRPKKKWYLTLFTRILVIYFVFALPIFACIGVSEVGALSTHQVSNETANVFGLTTLAFIIAEAALLAYMVYRMISKRRIVVAPSPPVPTDQEYENWVRSWQGPIRQYGMQKLGLDESDVLGRPL